MVLKIHVEKPANEDILVFLTGQDEIERAIQLLLWKRQSSIYDDSAVFIPLAFYTALPLDELNKVFEPAPPGMRKVVFSTTLAETSLTIRGIKYVVDCGKAKVRTFEPVSGLDILKVRVISQAQANQRAGRAGRESDGVCYRMYSMDKFNSMKKTSVPEIKRTNLSSVILQLLYWGVRDITSFDFLDKPKPQTLAKGVQMLKWLGAIVDDGGNCDDDDKKLYKLTAVGKQMVKFPLLPQYSKIIINANSYGCLPEILNIIAMLSADNILVDVLNKRNEIRINRSVLEDNSGDLITYLRIFSEYNNVNDKEKWCKKYYINERSMRVAASIKYQLKQLCIHEGFKMDSRTGRDYDTIIQCLCTGLFMNYARHAVDRFLTNDSQEAKIHPSSFLAKKSNAGAHVIYCELVHSNEVYMRYVSNVHPDWVKNAAPTTYEIKKLVQPDPDDVKRRKRDIKMGLK
ncbi:hypothetical protein HELRODRAFT_105082 [Helobdella robusta]|uniref:RNA helicase n=1 Tax=Helobdella robusta TaxID=6412 RepID=T1EDQ5_HELRO|nr:hypothetical protein HELRODRAFT_105082 [Helobdella robusta]ESO07051.1 hypothetical protein HELRODRAFT_105082 [Helobdella robusta]